jgi:hypothetical protein
MYGPVQLIPESWKSEVIKILNTGNNTLIDWTLRAQQDWQQFGMLHEALALLVRHLKPADKLGRQVFGMAGAAEVWEFLLPHPLNSPKPLYAKIGLKGNRLSIKIFSVHIDLNGDLEKAIQDFLKKQKK